MDVRAAAGTDHSCLPVRLGRLKSIRTEATLLHRLEVWVSEAFEGSRGIHILFRMRCRTVCFQHRGGQSFQTERSLSPSGAG